MLLTNRVILSDNTVLTDLSINLNNFKSGTETVVLVAAEDFLFVGSDLPFNHRYLDIGTANSNASVLSVSLWDGDTFSAAVDTIDETDSSGVTLAQSGVFSWKLDKNKNWSRKDTEDVTGLTTLTIYHLFWARFAVSADLSGGTTLNTVGNKFSSDADLGVLYPELVTSDAKNRFCFR